VLYLMGRVFLSGFSSVPRTTYSLILMGVLTFRFPAELNVQLAGAGQA